MKRFFFRLVEVRSNLVIITSGSCKFLIVTGRYNSCKINRPKDNILHILDKNHCFKDYMRFFAENRNLSNNDNNNQFVYKIFPIVKKIVTFGV